MLRLAQRFSRQFSTVAKRALENDEASSSSGGGAGKDIAKLFTNTKVQTLLRQLTGCDFDRLFRFRQIEDAEERPSYQLLTDEELKEFNAEIQQRAEARLVSPPYLPARSSRETILAEDPLLAGHDNAKLIFTDISYGIDERNRIVVTRDPNGTLRLATRDEHDKVMRLYFPRPWRSVKIPNLFQAENLQKSLAEGKHEFVLDRACLQFEPDDPDFIRVRTAVFEDLMKLGNFNSLWSTRHYAGFVFYLVLEKKIDDLLEFYAKNHRLNEIRDLLELYGIVHPEFKINEKLRENVPEFLLEFAKKEAKKRSALELLAQHLKDWSKTNIKS